MFKINFLIVLFLLPWSFASAAHIELKSYSVKLEHLSNQMKGSTEELVWDTSVQKCQGRYDSLSWKVLSAKVCQDLAQAFESNRIDLLAAQKSSEKQKHSALHQPRGLLIWKAGLSNYDWIVNLATSPVCSDSELKNCHEVQLDQPSKLAKKFREALTQTLGRHSLPEARE